MANAHILLMAEARKAGVDGYRNMSESELRAAIKSAKGVRSTPTKGKSSTSSSNGTKGKTAAKKVVKGKTATAKGKSKTTTPAKGKSKTATRKGSTSKTAPAKSKSRKATVKTAAAKGAQAKRPSTGRGKNGTRASLKDAKIDWHLESNVGQFGKRADVLDALAEHKGDYGKVFKALKRKATKFYPDRDKDAAEKMLVWLIGRVAYDYAYNTGQHTPAERAAYGTSEKATDVARREARAAARKPARKTAKRGKKTAAKGKGRR